MKKIYLFILSVLLLSINSNSQIVISQVYGGGGNTGAPYTHDFVELFNRGALPVSISGWSIQYTSATGTGNFGSGATLITELPAVTIQPGQYFLIQEAGGAIGSPLPTPDFIDPTPIAMAAAGGKIALVNTITPLGCNGSSTSCSPASLATIVDLVGYGTANFFEGAGATPAPSNTTSVLRLANGCTDNNNNSTDFLAGVPSPRNTSTPLNTCTVTNNLSVNDITLNEGNSGTTSFTFTISLSAPAPAGGVTFDIATANNTATAVDNDYVAQSLTGQTIAQGNTTYSFIVVVNGDAIVEPNETFFVNVTNVVGVSVIDGQGQGTITNDDAGTSNISSIQGAGSTASSGLFTVEAIVTGTYPTLSPAGFYIQEEDADADANPNTSEGIFVVSATSVTVGDRVRVTGTVQENGSTPSFNQAVFATSTVTILSNGNPLPSFTDITLPVTATADYEKYEGMLVRFPGTLTVTNNEDLGSFGELSLSVGGLVYQPTQIIDPNDNPASGTSSTGTSNVAAVNALISSNTLRTILLDDGRGTIPTLPYVNADNTVRVGSTITNISGILGFGFSQYRIQPIASAVPSFTPATRPAVPSVGAGNLKIASFNVLNYFNGDGAGAGFPTSRGASSLAEFTRQRDKIINAISQLNADVVGLIEIENLDINDATSALQDLVNGLNTAMGAGTYSFIDDDLDNNGAQDFNTDQIRCAIIYKPTVVTPVGAAMLNDNGATNRPNLAQTFNLIATNKNFNFVVNHFKSKGGTGTGADADQGDGQAAFNATRKAQATSLLNFFNAPTTGLITVSGTNRIISVGDYNAYYEEDPMDILRAGGYTVTTSASSYSYLFQGQVGSLDHAVVSPSLASTVTGVAKWNTNGIEPSYLDYKDGINSGGGDVVNPWASTYTVSPWRASDHDAIIMGLILDATLPVTLTHFTASKENTKSKISWTTTQEINSREFIIERSTNVGIVWQPIATVAAAGNSSNTINYSINDNNPGKGLNLYRLKTIDVDNKFEYSPTRRVNFENKYTFSIYPNPAQNMLQISFDNNTGADLNVQVLSVNGQAVLNMRKTASSQLFDLNISTLKPGMYFLKIITTDGTVNVQKFVKE